MSIKLSILLALINSYGYTSLSPDSRLNIFGREESLNGRKAQLSLNTK